MPNSHKWLLLEAESKLEHDRFIALINSLSEGFLAVNDDGIIELSNSIAMSILDTNVLKGKNLFETLKLVDRSGGVVELKDRLAGLVTNLSSTDWLIKKDDGSTEAVTIKISPVRTYEGRSKGGFVILISSAPAEN